MILHAHAHVDVDVLCVCIGGHGGDYTTTAHQSKQLNAVEYKYMNLPNSSILDSMWHRAIFNWRWFEFF